MPAILGQIRRRQIHRHAPARIIEARILDRDPHAIARLFHRGLRQADDRRPRQAAGQMHFDRNRRRRDAVLGAAVDDGEVHARTLACRRLLHAVTRAPKSVGICREGLLQPRQGKLYPKDSELGVVRDGSAQQGFDILDGTARHPRMRPPVK